MMNESILQLFENNSAVTNALIGTTFTWLVTALGASLVFFFKSINRMKFDVMLGFTGGVMLAASFWSLLAPAIEMSPGEGFMKVFPAALGFFLGACFIYVLDQVIPHLHINAPQDQAEGVKTNWHGTTLLILAITLHNIPEGLAIGVMFGGAAMGADGVTLPAAIALAIGIGIQDFPEGIAVSMPLRRQGMSRMKSFWYGQLSAIVEPIGGVLGAILVTQVQAILPYALAFSAGAMIYVVVEEVIPECQQDKYSDHATLGLILGFILMMTLDAGLA
jgi:ZIP family zinc transporter